VNNERIEPELLLEPHYRATSRRATSAGRSSSHTTPPASALVARWVVAGSAESDRRPSFYAHGALVISDDTGAHLV